MNTVKHSEKEIMEWAEIYTNNDVTLRYLSSEFHVPLSTIYWSFIHRLPYICEFTYKEVCEKLLENRRVRRRNR